MAVLAACADGPRASHPPESGSDAALSARVKAAIATDVGARAAGSLNVETYGGVVELSGFADSEQQATQAAQAAKKVQGVRSVKNEIRVKSS
ncbi:MAG TPA: BON domain-containing protein [Burkholderiales bacterium]|nr:BON domain-containing protein [Burkholderiales bacterium]